ncbi:MAG: hypothetical protein LQ343_003142 [Gyalolechia ehrenbergii]|nr:MAG: hypothetical protein LQ343_003142 [Gyalolechia ehrenbergii]
MSSASEERWRTSRGQQKSSDQNQNPNHSRQFNQQRGTFSREGGGSGQPQHDLVSGNQATRTMSGNVWVNNDRGSREAPRPAQEHHVPVNGFNAQEARNTLKNGSPILFV